VYQYFIGLPVSLSSGNVVRSRRRGVVPSILLISICSATLHDYISTFHHHRHSSFVNDISHAHHLMYGRYFDHTTTKYCKSSIIIHIVCTNSRSPLVTVRIIHHSLYAWPSTGRSGLHADRSVASLQASEGRVLCSWWPAPPSIFRWPGCLLQVSNCPEPCHDVTERHRAWWAGAWSGKEKVSPPTYSFIYGWQLWEGGDFHISKKFIPEDTKVFTLYMQTKKSQYYKTVSMCNISVFSHI